MSLVDHLKEYIDFGNGDDVNLLSLILTYCWWKKSGEKSKLRLAVYLIIYRVLAPSQVVVWDFFHQQYPWFLILDDGILIKWDTYKIPSLNWQLPPEKTYFWRQISFCKGLCFRVCVSWQNSNLSTYEQFFLTKGWRASRMLKKRLFSDMTSFLCMRLVLQKEHIAPKTLHSVNPEKKNCLHFVTPSHPSFSLHETLHCLKQQTDVPEGQNRWRKYHKVA